jgi:hypothetical protein
MDPTIKYFKLISGENIIATTETNCDDLSAIDSVTVIDPVLINTVRVPRNGMVFESFMMQPWIALSSEYELDIATSHILFAINVKESVEKQYQLYLEQDTVIDPDMVDDESTSFEDELREEVRELMEMMGEESEEDYHAGEEKNKPTFH